MDDITRVCRKCGQEKPLSEFVKDKTRELGRVYAELRAREIEIKEASEIANIAGKIINGAKAEMMYRIARKEKPSIPFFDADGK